MNKEIIISAVNEFFAIINNEETQLEAIGEFDDFPEQLAEVCSEENVEAAAAATEQVLVLAAKYVPVGIRLLGKLGRDPKFGEAYQTFIRTILVGAMNFYEEIEQPVKTVLEDIPSDN